MTQAVRPVQERKADPDANGRLTASNGTVLLVLLAVEGFTILGVRQMMTLHVFVGVLLIGPALLKTGSTVWRFVRYYRGDEAYVAKGPPHPILRWIGPMVVLTSLAVLGTGVALLAVQPGHTGLLSLAHKASFILWFGFMTIHVLGHLREALAESWHDLNPHRHDSVGRTRRIRLLAIGASLLVGAGLAFVLLPSATPWTHGFAGN